jgi:hypothetical protein
MLAADCRRLSLLLLSAWLVTGPMVLCSVHQQPLLLLVP